MYAVHVLERPSIPASTSHSPCTSPIIHLFDTLAAQESRIGRCGTTRPFGSIQHNLPSLPHVYQATFVELKGCFVPVYSDSARLLLCLITYYYLLPLEVRGHRPTLFYWTP